MLINKFVLQFIVNSFIDGKYKSMISYYYYIKRDGFQFTNFVHTTNKLKLTNNSKMYHA